MLNSVIFWKLLDMFILIIEWISLYILVNDLSIRKVSKNQNLLSFSLILGVSFAMNLFGIFPNLRVFISIVLSIFYVKLSYEVNLSKALTIPLVYWMMLIGIEALSISSIVYVNNIDVSVLLSPNLYRLETIILAKSFLFIGILMVKYFKLFSQISKNDFIYIGIPICTNILSLLIIFKQGISNLDIELIDNFNLILISFLILLSSISLLIIIYKIIISNKFKIENEFMKEKINLEYRYYKKIEENQEKIEERKENENTSEIIETETTEENEGIQISNDVIAVIAGVAVSEVQGVSSMAGGFAGGISEVLSGKKNLAKGIKVDKEENKVKIDVNIIVEYGTRIPDVAFEIQNREKTSVENMTGLKVEEVNVHVQGVNTNTVSKEETEQNEEEKEQAE